MMPVTTVYEDCTECCEQPGTIDTPCCEGVLLPETLLGTISDKTDNCTCLPDEVTFEYQGLTPEGNHHWQAVVSGGSCDGCNLQITCINNDPPTPYWSISQISGTGSACDTGGNATSESCDPLEIIFTVDNAASGQSNCDGSYTVTVTEVP